MLTEPTVDKLHEMRLRAMADAFRQQLANPSMGALSFEPVAPELSVARTV